MSVISVEWSHECNIIPTNAAPYFTGRRVVSVSAAILMHPWKNVQVSKSAECGGITNIHTHTHPGVKGKCGCPPHLHPTPTGARDWFPRPPSLTLTKPRYFL